jgi:hypothetical protein
MIRDGSFDALFLRYKGPLIERAHLKTRKTFAIDNPVLSPETQATRRLRPELWFDPAKGR